MKSHHPLVSIVTPVRNGSKYVEELIASVLDQDYSSIEHIIIDDGSNDNGATVEILKRYPHLRWWSRENRGAYATINEGLAATTGELVTVICADDKYACRTAISSAVRLWSVDPNCDAVYGETIRIDESGHEEDRQPPLSGPLWVFPYYAVVTHCSLLVRRSVIVDGKIFFDVNIPYAADTDWILRLIHSGCRFERLRQPIAHFRQHSMQRSHTGSAQMSEDHRRVMQNHGGFNPVVAFVVNKWWRFVKLRSLCQHRGFLVCFEAIRTHFRYAKPR